MAVVRNLMIRIGADYSSARKAMQGASRDLNRFKTDTTRSTKTISGKKGIGGINDEFKNLGRTVTSSLSQIKGSRGLGGIAIALGSIRPALGAATAGFRGLSTAAGGLKSVLGPVGMGTAAVTAALSLMTLGIYKASQAAARFEADIGRLNISLREGSRGYMEWARAQGLAKQSAAELGATYANLLGSFISDTQELQQSTQDLVHATRVIASYTGRSIDDVFNRIRSGMLGSTEAIEDLGVYVNISMIESTKAFRRFAGDKSWSQLDFQTQQQIRLAAILEQTYARYGNELQNAVLTKQELMVEQFKDVKLHLSQAFLPIWDAVLPALTALGEGLSFVTEQIARFTYWLRGWDYDERTKGIDEYEDSVSQVGDSFDEMGDKAAKARSELAAFDRLNLLGFGAGSGSGGGSGGLDEELDRIPREGLKGAWREFEDWLKEIPRILRFRVQVNFDPRPPDAGAGAVATAVIDTVNGMISTVRQRTAEMWGELDGASAYGLGMQLARWGQFAGNLNGALIPGMAANTVAQWSNLWTTLRSTTDTNVAAVQLTWRGMLDFMRGYLTQTVPVVQADMAKINESIRSPQKPLTETRSRWAVTLQDMLVRLRAFAPEAESAWGVVGEAVRRLESPLQQARSSWASALQDMYVTIQQRVSGIVSETQRAISALNSLRAASGQQTQATGPVKTETTTSTYSPYVQSMVNRAEQKQERDAAVGNVLWASSALSEAAKKSPTPTPSTPATSTGRAAWVDEAPILGDIYRGLDWVQQTTEPAAKAAMQFAGGSGAAGLAGRGIQWLQRTLKAIPGFADGAVVRGPTLAMVGEYAGAINNPEVIGPLSEFEEMMDDSEEVSVLRQILRAIERGQNVTLTISEDEIASAAIRGHNKRARRIGRSELTI